MLSLSRFYAYHSWSSWDPQTPRIGVLHNIVLIKSACFFGTTDHTKEKTCSYPGRREVAEVDHIAIHWPVALVLQLVLKTTYTTYGLSSLFKSAQITLLNNSNKCFLFTAILWFILLFINGYFDYLQVVSGASNSRTYLAVPGLDLKPAPKKVFYTL